mgnify:CR=1 FL=1
MFDVKDNFIMDSTMGRECLSEARVRTRIWAKPAVSRPALAFELAGSRAGHDQRGNA